MKLHASFNTWQRTAWGLLSGVLTLTMASYLLSRSWEPERRLTIAVTEGVEGAALKKVAEHFSNDNRVPVEIVELSYDQLFEEENRQLQQRPMADNAYHPAFDVIMVDDPWVEALLFGENGQSRARLHKLDLNEATRHDLEEDFFPSSLSVARYCGGSSNACQDYYGVPFVGNTQLFNYKTRRDDKSVWSPRSFAEVASRSQWISQNNQIGYIARIGPGNSIVTDFMPILWAEDPDSFSCRLKSNQDPLRPRAARAFQVLEDLAQANRGTTSVDDFDVASYLVRDKASMGIVWSAWAMALRNLDSNNADLPSTTSVNRFVELPGGAVPELGTWLLAVPENSDLKELSQRFIQFATTQEEILEAAQYGNPPPRKSVLLRQIPPTLQNREPTKKLYERYADLFELQAKMLEKARPRPRTPRWRELEGILGGYLSTFVTSNMSAEDAIRSANRDIRHILDTQARSSPQLTNSDCGTTSSPTGSEKHSLAVH